jgi:hypothetical protein
MECHPETASGVHTGKESLMNKILNRFSILCLIAVIAVMSWRDMNPGPKTDDTQALNIRSYYAGPDITPDMIPHDNRPVTIDVGVFSYAKKGELVWAPHGMPPGTFAQRQVYLRFNFKGMPQHPEKTLEKIQAVAKAWRQKGNSVSAFVLNYAPEKADFGRYSALIQAAYNKFTNVNSSRGSKTLIFAGINTGWGAEALKGFQYYTADFLIELPQGAVPAEMLTRLAALERNFSLQYPSGMLPDKADVEKLKKIDFMKGVVLTLDSRKPLPKNENKVGLFPKL